MEQLSVILRNLFLLLISFTAYSQEVPSDSLMYKFEHGKEDFIIRKGEEKYIIGNLWNDKLSILYIKKQNNDYYELVFSYSNVLVSKSEVRYDGSKYVKNGLSFKFNEDGNLSHIYTYKNGVYDGLFISYFDDGNIYEKGYYSEGEKKGIWMKFDKKLKIISRIKY